MPKQSIYVSAFFALFVLGVFMYVAPSVHAVSFPTFQENQNLGEFISKIYNLSIGLVGLAVLIQFIRAGLSYMLAAGNAGETHHAKEMMQNAVLGAILLLSAYLILNVINPDLTKTDLFNMQNIQNQLQQAPGTGPTTP